MIEGMTLQAMVRHLTEVAGLSQTEIATFCSTTQPTISAIATGSRKRTSYELGTAIQRLYEKHAGRAKR